MHYFHKRITVEKAPSFSAISTEVKASTAKDVILSGKDGGKTEAEFTFGVVYATILFKTSMNGEKYTGCMTCIGEEAACSAS